MILKMWHILLLMLWLVLTIHGNLFAQDSKSDYYEHQRHITFNPLNSDVYSYEQAGKIFIEKKGGDSQKIIYELVCGESGDDFGDFGTGWGDDSSSEHCSHLDWRPVLDRDRKLWFSYIHNENNTINFGYLDRSLNCEPAGNCNSFEVDLPDRDTRKNLSRPRWSPDGQNILFQKGAEIWIMYDLQELMRKESDFVPSLRNITEGSFFEWSPDQQFIAFEASNNDEPDIGIIKVSDIKVADDEALDIQYIGSLINRENERFKPSWSPDSKLLAYQVQGFLDEYWAVKLLGIKSGGDLIEVREITEGRNFEVEDYFKSNDERKGPEIVNFRRYNYPDDPNTYSFIVYVSADQSEQRPVKIHSIDRRFAIPPERVKAIPNNDYVAAYGSDGVLKIAYASQIDYAMRLTFDEVDLTSQLSSPPRFTPREIGDKRAVVMSSVFPGFGQFYKRDILKGTAFMTSTIALSGVLGYNISKGRSNYTMNITSGVLGGIYGLNLLSSASGFTKKDHFYFSALIPGLGQIMRGDNLKGGAIFGATAGFAGFLVYNSNHNTAYSPINISVALLLAGTYAYNIYDGLTGLPKVIGMDPDVVQVNIGMEKVNLKPERPPIPVLRLIF